jgi:hypothetical protein
MSDEKAIDGLAAAVCELDSTIHEIGRGLGAIHEANDVAVSPGILTSIAGSLERIAVSLDILAGVADHRVRRIP